MKLNVTNTNIRGELVELFNKMEKLESRYKSSLYGRGVNQTDKDLEMLFIKFNEIVENISTSKGSLSEFYDEIEYLLDFTFELMETNSGLEYNKITTKFIFNLECILEYRDSIWDILKCKLGFGSGKKILMSKELDKAIDAVLDAERDIFEVRCSHMYNKSDFLDIWLSHNLLLDVADDYYNYEDHYKIKTLDHFLKRTRRRYKFFMILNVFKLHYLTQSLEDIKNILSVGGLI